jgi:glycosyltransferase involved in cell wall biosynthesis
VQTFRQFGLRAPVAVMPNAVSPSWLSARGDRSGFRRRHGIDEGTRVMLFFSRIHPIKGLPMLLAALARHRNQLRDWRLLIAGRDEAGHRVEVERLAVQLGVGGSVSFLGPLFERNKRDAFAGADVFVLPTHTENFGIVIAEALGCSLPVITTQSAPWRELDEHRCGWWVAPDSASIGAALIDAASRPLDELRAMGARGHALVASRYVWPLIAERTIGLYRWLLGQAERPAFVRVD